jgi:PAS domain S-box-containing protein
MLNEHASRFVSSFKSFSKFTSLMIFFAGFSVLCGWFSDIPALKSVFSGYVPMTPNTAVCFILTGISLLAAQTKPVLPRPRIITQTFAFIVALVGILTLAEYIFGLNIGIDRIFFRQQVEVVLKTFPGRMSPFSAFNFFLIGTALLVLDKQTKNGWQPAQLLILLEGVVSLLALVGYAYGVSSLYSVGFYKPMALNSAFVFALVCIGILLARPDCGLMSVVTSDSEGGVTLRRLLLIVIGVPFLLGWLGLTGFKAGLYNLSFGLSMLAVSIIVVFAIVIWANAIALHKIDIRRIQAEEFLRESEGKYRVIFETSGAATVIFVEDKISLINSEFEKLSGYSKEEIESKMSLTDFFTNEQDLAKMENYHRSRWVDPVAAPINYEFQFVDRRKNVKDVFITIAMIPGTRKNIASLLDITERKHIEAMKSDFLSLVSHQLKTPVAEIKGYVYNMLSGITGELNPKQRQYLEEMQEISDKNYRLISDILNISRIERGIISVDIRSVGLKEIVYSALTDYYDTIKKKGLALNLDGLEQEISVLADKDKMAEAVINVINNAIKFTASGAITIRTGRETKFGIIEVSDTGPGMPADLLDKLFKKDQALVGAPEAGKGSGLGLYIAKQFMLKQNGDIAAASVLGKGSQFIFKIPLT